MAARRELMKECWIKWKAHTESLRTALAAHNDHHPYFSSASAPCSSSSAAHSAGDGFSVAASQKALITELLGRCLKLYKESLCLDSNDDALSSIAGNEHSPIEAGFLWLGGWRPTSVFTLIYTTLGLHDSQRTLFDHTPSSRNGRSHQELLLSINAALLDNRLSSSHPLQSPISNDELAAVESLRRKTLNIELHLSNELATFQMLLPNNTILEALSTKDMLGEKGHELMEAKVSQLTDLFTKANQLRIDTLESVLDVLDPIHSALCCVSAFELINALKSLH
ncbi:hypothetical protein L7F22_021513 [Adiantum nelumboides]|nr:hypothetical protein [Adiantum nelumboides]